MTIPDLKSPEELIDYGMDDVVIRNYIAVSLAVRLSTWRVTPLCPQGRPRHHL